MVEENFGGGKICCFGADFAWVINFVTSCCEADTPGVILHGSIGYYQAQVCCLSTFWKLVKADKVDCISAFGYCGPVSLCQASNFFTVTFFPVVSIAAFEKGAVFC